MLLIVCNVNFVTLVFPLPHCLPLPLSPPQSGDRAPSFSCAFVCKPGIARGEGREGKGKGREGRGGGLKTVAETHREET